MQSRFKDWGDARVFLAVIREGSTLAASRVLGINQTTVSRRLDVMEHALNVTLFERSTRGATPTEAARALVPLAEALEQAAHALEREALAQTANAGPPIRFSAFDQGISGQFSSLVSDFVADQTDITFEFIWAERLLDLIKGEADVALRLTNSISDDRLIARKIGVTAWTYYAARDYAARNGTPEAYCADMSPHRVALLSHVASKRPNVLRCASGKDLLAALRSGQAIGPLAIYDGDRDPDLVRCFEPPETAWSNVWLVASPEAYKRPEVRRFMAFAVPRLTRIFMGGDA